MPGRKEQLYTFLSLFPSKGCEFHEAINLCSPTSTTFSVIKETQNFTTGSCIAIIRLFSILTSASLMGYMTRWFTSGHFLSTGRFGKTINQNLILWIKGIHS